MYPQYMCIMLYVKLICSAICDIYLVKWYSIDLLSIGVGGRCIFNICVFCYM